MKTPVFFKIWFAICAVFAFGTIAAMVAAIYTVASDPSGVAREAGQIVGEAKRGYDEAAKPEPTPTNTADYDASAAVVGVAAQM